MRRLFTGLLIMVALLGIAALFASTPATARATCDTVRCLPCPDGFHLRLQPPNCCQCIRN